METKNTRVVGPDTLLAPETNFQHTTSGKKPFVALHSDAHEHMLNTADNDKLLAKGNLPLRHSC